MRYPQINPAFFTANRNSLRNKMKPGSVAFVFANRKMYRTGDQFYPYKQNSDFFYLTGIEQEESILMLSTKNEDKGASTLFILKSNPLLETWEGHKLNQEEAKNISGVEKVHYTEEFEQTIHAAILEADCIYFNLPEHDRLLPALQSWDYEFVEKIKSAYPLHKYDRLSPLLKEARLRKSKQEIDLIKKACSITKEAFLKVLEGLGANMKEYEIEAIINYVFTKQGANGHGYEPIIASGKNACVLHYIENNSMINHGDLVLMDFGAEYANYSADLSRTIPSDKKFSARQKELYNSVLKVFKFARKCIKPGVSIHEYHKEVCELWQEEHVKLGRAPWQRPNLVPLLYARNLSFFRAGRA